MSCRHGERCGGCPLLSLDYGSQLDHKAGRLRDAIGRYPALAALPVDATLGAATLTGYRTRAKLAVGGGARLGLYRELGHAVVDIPDCQVIAPALARVAAALRELLRAPPPEAGAALAAYTRHGKGALLGVDLREAAGQGVLCTLIVARERNPSARAAQAAAAVLMRAAPEVIGVALGRRAALSPRFLGDEAPEPLAGVAEALDPVGGVELYARHGAFVQAHRDQAARLAAEVAARLGETLGGLDGKRVLELFAGSGAIGLSLARAGAALTLVEQSELAATAARDAAARSGGAVEVIVEDAAAALRRLAAAGARYDAVVVDPPRRGLGPALRAALPDVAPVCVYVSCEPRTLARDLDHLGWLGMKTTRLQPLDMIPLSDEVETIATLVRGPAPRLPLLHVDVDLELTLIDKPPHHDAPRSPGLPALDASASGIWLTGKAPAEPPLVTYLAWVKGITRERGAVTRPIEGQPARTRYARIDVVAGHSLLEIDATPGRRQQIRRHLAAIGHPVIGDRRHGHAATNRHFEERAGLDRPFLHCARVEIGERVLESPLAGDLQEALARAAAGQIATRE